MQAEFHNPASPRTRLTQAQNVEKPLRRARADSRFSSQAYSFPRAAGNFYAFTFGALIYYGNKLAERQRRLSSGL